MQGFFAIWQNSFTLSEQEQEQQRDLLSVGRHEWLIVENERRDVAATIKKST